jgi:hypothetical protein
MLNNNAFCKTNYFLDYDLINKYNLLNLSQKPRLDLIKLNISLNSFYNSVAQDKSQLNVIKNVSFLKKFLYIFSYSFSPYLFYIKINKTVSKKKTLSTNCYLQLLIKGNSNLYTFLTTLLADNFFIIKQIKKTISSDKILESIELITKKTFFIIHTMSVQFFSDLNTLISNLFNNIYIKDLLINLFFIFKKNKNFSVQISNSFIQNLFLFWV